MRRRSRVCNGAGAQGSSCRGAATQERPCACVPRFTSWQSWTSWSSCSAHCSRRRQRSCPSPSSSCPGRATDSLSCSGDLCRREDKLEPSSFSRDVALYVGLSLVVLVFLLVLLALLSLARRRRLPGGYSITEGYRPQATKLGFRPDLTDRGGKELGSVCYEYNSKGRMEEEEEEEEEHHYEQPMVRLASRSPVDSLAKTLLSSSSSSSTGGTTSPHSASTMDTALLPTSPFTRWTMVCQAGARISLPHSGISLTVPEAALSSPHQLCIASIHDTKAFPPLLPGQTLLSPVVYIGSSVARPAVLSQPAVLSLPHCASLRQGGWRVSVSWRPPGDTAWRNLVTLGQERLDSAVYAQLDLATVHLVTENLGTFCLLGAPTSATSGPLKSLRMAAFCQEVPQSADLSVRIYCVQDCEAAQTYLEWTERQFGGRLLSSPSSCLLQHSVAGAPLSLQLAGLAQGWQVAAGAELQQLPFSLLWTDHNPALHCSFILRRTAPHLTSLALSLAISQEGHPHPQRSTINVHTSLGRVTTIRTSSSSCLATSSPWRLPVQTKASLARMLDAPVTLGNDWRLLAERLNMQHYIAYFGTKASPTRALLVLWEARNRETAATQGLQGILRGMGRQEAARLLEQHLRTAH